MGTTDHLRPYQFKPGHTGFKGRKKRKTIEGLIEAILDEPVGYKGLKRRDNLARVFVDRMLEGDVRFLQLYVDRVWPKVDLHAVFGFDPRDEEQVSALLNTEIAALPEPTAEGAGTIEARLIVDGASDADGEGLAPTNGTGRGEDDTA